MGEGISTLLRENAPDDPNPNFFYGNEEGGRNGKIKDSNEKRIRTEEQTK